MKRFLLWPLGLVASVICLSGCKRESVATPTDSPAVPHSEATPGATLSAEDFHEVTDPIDQEIEAFRLQTRLAYNERRFEELEKVAAELCASKAVFGNGSWKIAQFHGSLECRRDEPESMWQLHDEIHRAWIAAKPESATARVAYGNFLTDYAWRARGSGYANTVSDEGWRLMRERLESARKVLIEARQLPSFDPFYGVAMLTVALGQEWPALGYEALLTEVKAKEPGFWGYQRARAYSLLPRWYGEPGDWEAYAEKEAAEPKGLGPEIYACIVLNLSGYYKNVFAETKASWPKTREGLEVLLKKYPESLGFLNDAAVLATRAEDKAFAKALFAKMGPGYLHAAWGNAGRVAAARAWAETR